MNIYALIAIMMIWPLSAKEPGVLILKSDSPICSLNQQAVWLEKNLPAGIKKQSISDTRYSLQKRDFKENVVFLTSRLYRQTLPHKGPYPRIFCIQSMVEGSRVCQPWVDDLNTYFDFVTVPCEFLVDVYKDSGVNIPIFPLSMGTRLEEWSDIKYVSPPRKPFVFIASGSMIMLRKNHDILVEAFLEAFGDSEDVLLKIQVRESGRSAAESLVRKYDLNNRRNIRFHYGDMADREYRKFFCSGHCLVNISGGEGYSIPPREALAIGMPAIVTNNSAQMEICSSGLVRSVECENIVPVVEVAGTAGYKWNPTVGAVKEALLDMYHHYPDYLELAKHGPEWIKQFTAPALTARWATLLHPKAIVLGDRNEVRDDCLITDSEVLYKKYTAFMGIKP